MKDRFNTSASGTCELLTEARSVERLSHQDRHLIENACLLRVRTRLVQQRGLLTLLLTFWNGAWWVCWTSCGKTLSSPPS